MGLRDALLGKKKLSEPKEDRLFALTTAAVTLQTELGLKTAGVGAIAFKPQSSGEFRSAFDDVDQLVEAVAKQSGSTIERTSDQYGFDWMIIHDPELEDLVDDRPRRRRRADREGLRPATARCDVSIFAGASIPSTGSMASSEEPSGRSSPRATSSATTPPSSSSRRSSRTSFRSSRT